MIRSMQAYNKTNKPSVCAQRSPSSIDESLHSTDFIDPAMSLDILKPFKEAKFTKAIKAVNSRKPVASSKIIKAKKSFTSLIHLFCYGNPKRRRTQSLARSDSL